MNILNPRVAFIVQLTLVRQKILFFKRSIERKSPLPSKGCHQFFEVRQRYRPMSGFKSSCI
jgi:hypothetical protein